jgi:hypothetical protein
MGVTLALISFTLLNFVRSRRQRIIFDRGFVDFWGALTSEYVAAAANEPEGFEQYRERRRRELLVVGPKPFVPRAFFE